MRPSPEELERRYQLLPPIGIPWIKRLKAVGVSVDALCEPELPACAAIVLNADRTFDFGEEASGEQATEAMLFLARDEEGDPADIVAWEPRSKRLAAWSGAVALLGAENLLGPRLDPHNALEVFASPIDWLIAERLGVVIVDPTGAAPILRAAEPLKVHSTAFGKRLALFINPRPPRILAPLAEIREVA
jgi:hypothetical protein